MIVHFTKTGDVHDGPERGCQKCKRPIITTQQRKQRGRLGGKKTASKKQAITPKVLIFCSVCGKEMSKIVRTGMCQMCWRQSNKAKPKENRTCSICGKTISQGSTSGLCHACALQTPEAIARRNQQIAQEVALHNSRKPHDADA